MENEVKLKKFIAEDLAIEEQVIKKKELIKLEKLGNMLSSTRTELLLPNS